MSRLPFGSSLAQAFALNLINAVLIRPRAIGPFIAQVTVEEKHVDELQTTDHPVEYGAAITDHAFKRPAQLSIRCGYSNSSPAAFANPNYVQQIYQQFLALQESRLPFAVITGKRFYTDMLMVSLRTDTDERTENMIAFTVDCKQIILVSTQTTIVPPADQLQAPSINGATQNNGTRQLGDAPNFNGAITVTPRGLG